MDVKMGFFFFFVLENITGRTENHRAGSDQGWCGRLVVSPFAGHWALLPPLCPWVLDLCTSSRAGSCSRARREVALCLVSDCLNA